MDIERSKELWEHLDNEPERAYRAFQTFLSLPSDHRTVIEAYRHHVGNPEALKPSDTWARWSLEFGWRERAAAYDDHLAGKRRDAYERGMEQEAERQGALAERIRNRMNELMTLSYEQAMRWLEEVGASGMRAADVIAITRLHMEAVKAFSVPEEPREEGWTEEDERDFVERILPQIEAVEDYREGPDEGSESDPFAEKPEEDG